MWYNYYKGWIDDMNNIIDLKPRYFDERKEIQIFVEYLIDSYDTIHKTLAEEINNKGIKSIVIQTLLTKNENIDYWPKFFDFLNKDSIEELYLYIKFNDEIYKFNNLRHLGINLHNYKNVDINQFNNLDSVVITGYNNNFESTILNDKIKNIVFWKFKKSSFDYKIDMNKVEKITFMNYTTLDIRNIKTENIKSLSVDKTKKILFNLDNLSNLNYLNLCSCDTSSINNEVIGNLKQLEELWLEKCDLSFIDENTISLLPKLKVLVIDKCKNLKTISGMKRLERFVILNTKVEEE